MSSLYASIETDGRAKTTATRCGHHYMSAHVRGWDEGGAVEALYDPDTQKVTVRVYRTGGSNGGRIHTLICEWTQGDDTPRYRHFGQMVG